MTEKRETSRRWFLRTSAVTIGAAGLAGCGEDLPIGGSEGTTTTETTTTTTETTTTTTTAGPEGAERIAPGEARLLEIQEDAPTDPERGDRADPVVFEGEAGMGVEITMRSDDVDPYLVLEGPDGSVVAQNDDGADGLNARIRMVLEQSGTYVIWAGSFSGEATGSYTLTVDSYEPAERRSIAVGETNDYEIRENDGAEPARGELGAPIEFEGEADTWVVIDMESEAFDTVLILQGPDGEVVTGDDDGGEGLNSRIRVELEQSGTYTIWASSFDGSDTGPFTLTLEEVEVGAAGTRSISVGQTREFEIRPDDSISPRRESLAAPVEFEGSADQNLEISMSSDAIDTYLELEAPDGSIVAQNDDGGSGFDSRITIRLGQSGTYTIWCGSFGRNEMGPFTLSVDEFEPAEPRSIAVGETNDYEIRPNDSTDPERGSLAAPVEFEGEDGTRVEIDMTSNEIDTYLVLEAPNGSVVAENDDGGDGLNSRIETTLGQSGTYTIWCGSFGQDETGRFTLSVQET